MAVGDLTVNEKGGAQSELEGAPHLVPAEALLRLSQVVAVGKKRYAANNWRKIPYEEHISHALEHLFLEMNGDTSDDHAGHALTRLAFAVATKPAKGFDFKAWRPIKEPSGKKPTTKSAKKATRRKTRRRKR